MTEGESKINSQVDYDRSQMQPDAYIQEELTGGSLDGIYSFRLAAASLIMSYYAFS